MRYLCDLGRLGTPLSSCQETPGLRPLLDDSRAEQHRTVTDSPNETPVNFVRKDMTRPALQWSALVCLWSVSCSAPLDTFESECEMGTLGCACYGNWSCNYQLSCVDEVCVDRRDRDAAAEPYSHRLQSLPDPLAAATSDDCAACLHDECNLALQACYAETGCIAVQACVFECERDALPDASCRAQCSSGASSEARRKSAAVAQCSDKRCSACGQSG